jgi:hypothetical protein
MEYKVAESKKCREVNGLAIRDDWEKIQLFVLLQPAEQSLFDL